MDAPDSLWDESFAINFNAVRKLTQAFLPGMVERRWGRIINVTGTSEPGGTNAAGPPRPPCTRGPRGFRATWDATASP